MRAKDIASMASVQATKVLGWETVEYRSKGLLRENPWATLFSVFPIVVEDMLSNNNYMLSSTLDHREGFFIAWTKNRNAISTVWFVRSLDLFIFR